MASSSTNLKELNVMLNLRLEGLQDRELMVNLDPPLIRAHLAKRNPAIENNKEMVQEFKRERGIKTERERE